MLKKATCTLLSLFVLSTSIAIGAETPAAETPKADPDGGWPRITTSGAGAKVLMHQPQIESWQDQKAIVAWAAVEVLFDGRENSDLGVVKLEAKTSVSIEERLVKLDNIHLTQVNFPTLDQAKSKDVTGALIERFPKEGLVIALDRVMAAVEKSAVRTSGAGINLSPPPIFYSKRNAILVQFDGEPITSPIKDSTLKFIVNTNWDVLFDPDTSLYYLRNKKNWYSSKTLENDWTPESKLPKTFETLPKVPDWDEVRENIPPKSISKRASPTIFVSKQPAELIITDGKPKKERIGKTKLYWIKNTECDVFQMKKGLTYVLVSGRWFSAEKFEGPWKFATPDLPQEFQSIPRTHERARVRAAIPGTDEAAEAVLLAQIPHTLTIAKEGLQIPEVKYQGAPEFKEIKGTKVSYAANCANDVLKVGDVYYLCFQGAWFQSKQPAGPWALAESVPDEIYKIPAECPVHHVTYVRIESATAESVTYAQTSGYSGVTVSFGVAMWGTGWYYPPYYYGGVYYPYPHSYGSYAVYNSRTGAYGYGSSVSGPNGGISRAATYNPNTGTYARGTVARSGSEVRASGQAYNPRTGTAMETRQGRNANGSWGTTKVQRGDDWIQSGRVKNDQGSVSGIRTSEGGGAIRASGEGGSGFVGKQGDTIYAGKDGNVYRKTEDGWQQHGEGGWSDANRGDNPSASPRDQLNRDAGARQQGNQRVERSGGYDRGASSYQRGSSGRSGSYGGSRPSGGARGGGGRRR